MHTRNDHSKSPCRFWQITRSNKTCKDQRHNHISNTATQISPATGHSIGSAYNFFVKHDRRVILRNYKRCADDANRQSEK